MDKLTWLFYASAAVWVILGLYLFIQARKQSALARRLAQMEQLFSERN